MLPARRRRDERGAVALFVALSLALLMIITAFAVDLGMQRVARRDAQAIADVVSLDMARELDGRAKSAYSTAALDRAFAASLARNEDGLGARPADYSYELGRLDAAGSFESIGASDPATAVRVTAVGSVGYLFTGGRGDVTRSAVSTSDQSACIRIGSFAARLDSAQSALLNPLLSAMLNTTVQLSAVSYEGLARARVSLLDLVSVPGLGVGTVDALLELPSVSVGKLFVAAASVLDRQGNLVEANVLRALAVGVMTPTISVGDLVGVRNTSDAALEASLNVLDLIVGSAYLVAEDHLLSVPDLVVGVPGLAVTQSRLSVIEGTRGGCLRVSESVETAQVRYDLTARVDPRSVSALGSSVAVGETEVTFSLDLGKAIATLQGLQCRSGSPEQINLAVRSALVGSIDLSVTTRAQATVAVPLGDALVTPILKLLGLGSLVRPPSLDLVAPIKIEARAAVGGTDKDLVLPLPASYDTPQGTGSGALLTVPGVTVSSATTLDLTYWDPGFLGAGAQYRKQRVVNTDPLFTAVVNPVLSAVTASILTPLVTQLQNNLVLPLARLLGAQVGGADVFAVRTPACSAPRLRQ